MTPKQINELVLSERSDYAKSFVGNGFKVAVFDEVCEKISSSGTLQSLTKEGIILAAITAFQTAYEMMKETINALLKVADTVSLNYRKQTFQFNKDSVL
ncbi:MAG: hypothetical protein JO072_04220 [Parafilimonas sp.]|nr:hypothetical protein [Parafilimonas sp.]